MVKKHNKLILISLLFILDNCKQQKISKNSNIVIKEKIKNKLVRLKIADVECGECVSSIEILFRVMPGILKAKYYYKDLDYENGILELELDPNTNLDLALVKKSLNKLGFDLINY